MSKNMYFLNNIALRTIIKIAKKYSEALTIPAFSLKKYPENIAIIGNFALHGINGTSTDVIFLSSSFSIILLDIIPGTLHPEPIINGIIAFPLNPIFLKMLSSKKAILDIYPVASNIEIHVNKIVSCGTNEITADTPLNAPSIIKL